MAYLNGELVFRCGHPRTRDNIIMSAGYAGCKQCTVARKAKVAKAAPPLSLEKKRQYADQRRAKVLLHAANPRLYLPRS